jgi:hypothetical protein
MDTFNSELLIDRHLPVVNQSSELVLFATDSLSFDTVNVTLFWINSQGCGAWMLNWDITRPLSAMIGAITRILCSTLLIPYLVGDMRQFGQAGHFEKTMTAFFTIITILYVDPFYVFQLFWPSEHGQLCHLMFRDVYFAAVGFYTIRLFGYFTPDDGECLNSGFPASVAVVILAGLLVQDLAFRTPHIDLVLPDGRVSPFDRLTVSHCYGLALLCVIVVWRAIQVGPVVPDASLRRHRYYTIGSITFLLAMVTLVGLEVFTDRLEDIRGFVITAVVTAFALFVEYIHSEEEEFPYGEYDGQGLNPLITEEEIALGADEDSGQIEVTSKNPTQPTNG